MKPGDHPDFFRVAPPPGTSRESSIRLDAEGRFWHDEALVENPALVKALHRWIASHPDNGRFILTNGYDWTYFTVEDAPYMVTSVRVADDAITLTLSDDTTESLVGTFLRVGPSGALYTRVKENRFDARFSRHAQLSLAPALEDDDAGNTFLRVGGKRFVLP